MKDVWTMTSRSIIFFLRKHEKLHGKHPFAQKPIALLERLIEILQHSFFLLLIRTLGD